MGLIVSKYGIVGSDFVGSDYDPFECYASDGPSENDWFDEHEDEINEARQRAWEESEAASQSARITAVIKEESRPEHRKPKQPDSRHPLIKSEPDAERQQRGGRIKDWLEQLVGPDRMIEIRAPRWGKSKSNIVSRFAAGHYRRAAIRAMQLEGQCEAVYVVMNGAPVGMKTGDDVVKGVEDAEVPSRSWILIDVDPVRLVPENTSKRVNSTASEKEASHRIALAIVDDLKVRGWPDPVLADSGNGTHLLYRVALPNVDAAAETIKRALKALASKYDQPSAKIDAVVYNASRLVKLHGTLTCKGDESDERPARLSRLINVPPMLGILTIEQLEALAAEAPEAVRFEPRPMAAADASSPSRLAPESRPDALARAMAYQESCEPAVEGENGHTQAFMVACNVGPGFGLSRQDAIAVMHSYSARCSPPWSDREIEHKVDEAYKARPNTGWLLDRDREGWNPSSSSGHVILRSKGVGAIEAGSAAAGSDQIAFRPLRPFMSDLSEVPVLESDDLPYPFGPWVMDCAKRGGYSPDFQAVAALVTAGAMIGRRLAVLPKRNSDAHIEFSNLWGVSIGQPSMKKSPALSAGYSFAYKFEEEAHTEWKQKHAAWVKRSKGKDFDGDKEPEPIHQIFIQRETSIEKLVQDMSKVPGGMFMARDELGQFFANLASPGKESYRNKFMEMWSGGTPTSQNTILRGVEYVRNSRLSIMGTIQPGPFAKLINEGTARGAADGLFPRFLACTFPDAPDLSGGARARDFREDLEAKRRVGEIFTYLHKLDPFSTDGQIHPTAGIHTLRFSPAAQEVQYDWEDGIERLKLIEPSAVGELLGKYGKLFCSLSLIFHVIDCMMANRRIGSISAESAIRAKDWCRYFFDHSKRLYNFASDGNQEGAIKLWTQIRAKRMFEPFKLSSIPSRQWAGLTTAESVDQAAAVLHDRGFIHLYQPVLAEPSKGGRPPGFIVYVNPAAADRSDSFNGIDVGQSGGQA